MVLTKIPGSLITDASITSADITDSTITNAKMVVDPANASNLSSGDVPLAQLGNVPAADLSSQSNDIALLAFKTQANGNLARYNLVDQSVDAFEDASGVDASASTNETYDSSGKSFSGTAYGAYSVTGLTTVQTSTWTVPANVMRVEALIVAGGGAGGANHYAAGGGAGGIVHHTSYPVTAAANIAYTVGAGAPNVTAPTYAGGGNGSNSVFDGMTAIGGGGSAGGSGSNPASTGGSGGGGAAGGEPGAASSQPAVSGASVYDNAGGNAGPDPMGAPTNMTGGGGGAGAVGATGSQAAPDAGNTTTGAGGVGKLFPGFEAYGTDSSNIASTGSNGGWFGGGGGGAYFAPKSAGLRADGGVGGGGKGGHNNPVNTIGPTPPAIANTGGGGGGWSYGGGGSSAGGSGFVGLRYRTEAFNNMTLISVGVSAAAAPTKGDIVLTYTDFIGTATINTDLIASISMDNGSTYTDITNLASQGTTGGHTILTANDVALTSTSGTSMRWKVRTLNQSTTKSTVLHAVSLGWS